ncbi:unnamed protein product [Phaeothamnion confervicola]
MAARIAEGALALAKRPIAQDIVRGAMVCWSLGFARTLKMNDHIVLEKASTEPGRVIASYDIPSSVCTLAAGGEEWLGCGVTLALFDEISSLAIMLGDRTFRAGVSVSMYAQMFEKVRPGERCVVFCDHNHCHGTAVGDPNSFIAVCQAFLAEACTSYLNCALVLFRFPHPSASHLSLLARCGYLDRVIFISTTTKTGAMLGYADTEMRRSSDGRLAAWGRHIKYLPMGRLWDAAMHPAIYPLARHWHQRDLEKRAAEAAARPPAPPPGGRVADTFGLALEAAAAADVERQGTADGISLGSVGGELEVRPEHLNYVGSMHGGAVCTLAEQLTILAAADAAAPGAAAAVGPAAAAGLAATATAAAAAAATAAVATAAAAPGSPWLRFMEAEYLLPGKGRLHFGADFRSGGLGTGTAAVTLARGGRMSAMATCIFGD